MCPVASSLASLPPQWRSRAVADRIKFAERADVEALVPSREALPVYVGGGGGGVHDVLGWACARYRDFPRPACAAKIDS